VNLLELGVFATESKCYQQKKNPVHQHHQKNPKILTWKVDIDVQSIDDAGSSNRSKLNINEFYSTSFPYIIKLNDSLT
jgi:hypothetical protein